VLAYLCARISDCSRELEESLEMLFVRRSSGDTFGFVMAVQQTF